jgi:hypothetical protein
MTNGHMFQAVPCCRLNIAFWIGSRVIGHGTEYIGIEIRLKEGRRDMLVEIRLTGGGIKDGVKGEALV